jgi:Ca-activated chloride channel family protein
MHPACSTFLKRVLVLLAVAGGSASRVPAQGILLPGPDEPAQWRLPRTIATPDSNQLDYRIESLDIDARLIAGISEVDLTQTFVNDSKQTIRSRCVMPLPYDATVQKLTFLIDGEEIEGRMLAKDKANEIFESYVRRNKDPALVQWIGYGLLQTDVFPIPPGAKRVVTIRYSQIPKRTDGMIDWSLPLTTARYSTKPVEKIALRLTIDSDTEIGNIYSPTHKIETEQAKTSAVVTFTAVNQVPAGDFRVLVSDSNEKLNANVVAYRPDPNEAGYFAMMLHPGFEADSLEQPKDVVFLLDKSGSMRGAKIDQARKALQYVLDNLPKPDRYGIIAYDSSVQSFSKSLTPVKDTEQLDAAGRFARRLGASGSTNIEAGFAAAMQLLDDSDRPCYVIHLSDGMPTVGERDDRKLTADLLAQNERRARIFNFGVGFDVNSRLLERISNQCFGKTFFVSPEQSVEEPVSILFNRLSQGAIQDVRWDVEHAKANKTIDAFDTYPSQIPDLFRGDRSVVFGRYSGQGKALLTITGTLHGEKQTFKQTVDFRNSVAGEENAFVAPLWASRRAAAIVDEIDLEGNSKELIAELIELSKRYGVLTPYTALIAEEPTPGQADFASRSSAFELPYLGGGGMGASQAITPQPSLRQSGAEAFRMRDANNRFADVDSLQANESTQKTLSQPSMSASTTTIDGRSGSKSNPQPPETSDATPPPKIRRIGDRSFRLIDDRWIDSLLGVDANDNVTLQDAIKIERFSDAYFDLIQKHGKVLRPLVDTPSQILIRLNNKIYKIAAAK